MEREVFTATVNIDAGWYVTHRVTPHDAIVIGSQTLVRQHDGTLRSLWFGEQVFDSEAEALDWVARTIERRAAEIAGVAADIRRKIEVPV